MYACEIHVICYHILIHADYYLMILHGVRGKNGAFQTP